MPKVAKTLLVFLVIGLIGCLADSAQAACADTSGALDTIWFECGGTPDTLLMQLRFKSDNPTSNGLAAFGWPVLITVTNNALVRVDTTVATLYGGTAVQSWPLPQSGTGYAGPDPAVSPVHLVIGNVQFGPGITGSLLLANVKVILTGDTTTVTVDTLTNPPLIPAVVTSNGCEYSPYWTPPTCNITSVKDRPGSGITQLPQAFELNQNFPNPFNATTQIQFALPKSSHVKLEIFNVLGQKIKTLVDEELQAGYKQVTWDGKDQRGNLVSTGIYFYRIRAENQFTDMRKMLLIK